LIVLPMQHKRPNLDCATLLRKPEAAEQFLPSRHAAVALRTGNACRMATHVKDFEFSLGGATLCLGYTLSGPRVHVLTEYRGLERGFHSDEAGTAAAATGLLKHRMKRPSPPAQTHS
jgi:hypothetical protein